MKIPDQLRHVIYEANRLSQEGQYPSAESRYQQAINTIVNDPGLVGLLYMDLGINAVMANSNDKAVTYYREAIKVLENLRGDGFLECAHAYYNLAYILLENSDATEYAKAALKRYENYPYSSPLNITNARMLYFLTLLYSGNAVISEEELDEMMQEIWREILDVKGSELDQDLLSNFLINFLSIEARNHTDRIEEYLHEIYDWIPEEQRENLLKGASHTLT
jgi:tetratricopeptide (TPR) repeat protein